RAPASTSTAKPATLTPPPTVPPPAPATAAKSDFTNSLGMQFVKVPGTQVLFCIHETRKKDFKAFTAANPDFSPTGIGITGKEDEPVRAVSWDDAKAYCAWLSKQ
ncbi:MAG: SUMF1/EgtB/PvdO family nonheme iron enzyme, partial [Verrucomicrobiae bacterium]|nr:SUMF1/EgtB/PvdO family nonheme iron enzyme [Verrucomicrobiae bacterium]